MLYDVFISHASEDKDSFVREFAEKLMASRIEVWYDEYSLKPGDSLRREIDKGLSKSRFGIVVFSKHFFSKQWTQYELDGLVSRWINSNSKVIVPIWHNIDSDEVSKYSSSLSNIVAIKSDRGIDFVVDEIVKIVFPQDSSLIIARDILFKYEFSPPVITDDWWLDVIEYSGTINGSEILEFPIPRLGNTPRVRGLGIAWAAMQKNWQEKADMMEISSITHPQDVLKFISSQPGLSDICSRHIMIMIQYFPQLTINGFGGEFENAIDELYQKSKIKYQEKQRKEDTLLAIDEEDPLCDEEFALRDKRFGNYHPDTIACRIVQGELFGLNVRYYEPFDYIIWLLSIKSKWLPSECRDFLIQGMKEWSNWIWQPQSSSLGSKELTGEFSRALYEYRDRRKKIVLNERAILDIKARIELSCEYLELDDDINDLYASFIESKFIEAYLKKTELDISTD